MMGRGFFAKPFEKPIDNLDPKKTKSDAERLAAWMRKGGFVAHVEKIDGKWHVITTGQYED